MRVTILRVAASAAAALALSGCGSLKAIDTESIATKGAVQFAVMNEIEQSGDRVAKAKKIAEDVQGTRTMFDGEAVTLADLHVKVMQRLAEKELEPSRMLGATLIVEAVMDHLDVQIGEGVLSPDDRVTVNEVLDWVEQAARFYVPSG